MDWFLYDNGLRHERVKYTCRLCKAAFLRNLSLCNETIIDLIGVADIK